MRCPANQHQNGVQAAARRQNPGDENRALVSHPQSPPVYLPSDLRSTLSRRESTVLIVLRRCVMLFLSTADRGRPKPKEVFFYGRRASARKKWYLLCGQEPQSVYKERRFGTGQTVSTDIHSQVGGYEFDILLMIRAWFSKPA